MTNKKRRKYFRRCGGFGKSDCDDEPCDKCKRCKLLYTNRESEEDDER